MNNNTLEQTCKNTRFILVHIVLGIGIRKTLMTAKIVLEFLLNKLHGPSCQVHGKLEIPLRNHTAHAQILHTYPFAPH